MTDRKHSIRKKYSLEPEEKIGNGWDTYEFENAKNVYMDVELIKVTTVGNLSTYSRSITDPRVKDWLKSLKFSYKKVRDIGEI